MVDLRDAHESAVFNVLIARVIRTLFLVVAVLACLSILGQFSRYILGHGRLYGFVDEFYLDQERNTPTYFSSFILLMSSILLGIIYRIRKQSADPFRKHWLILSLVFLYLSVDKFSSIHEMLILPLRESLGTNQWFYYAWIIPGAIITLALGIYFLKFLFQLPQEIRQQFILAGGVFVGGALGVEVAGGFYAFHHTEFNFPYSMIATLEEVMEMAGIILFTRALLIYIANYITKSLVIKLA